MRTYPLPLILALTILFVSCAGDGPRRAGAERDAPSGEPPAPSQEGSAATPLTIVPASAPDRLLVGDEIDALAESVRPPARFAAHRPQWRVEERTFVFAQKDGPETKRWQVVLDGQRVVAVLRSGDINLVGFTPDAAPTRLAMPTARYHLDNLLGPSLATHQFLVKTKQHGAIYAVTDPDEPQDRWEGSDRHLALVRSQRSAEREIEHRFNFTVDPVYGYRIDGLYRIRCKTQPGPKETFAGATFCPGNYTPWAATARYDRTVFTPAGSPGIRGWANNLLCMDRCDSDRRGTAWRDGGFIAYLDPRGGWSPCRTRSDGAGAVKMQVCNAHDDFHVNIRIPPLEPDAEGWRTFVATHRLLILPPEMTRTVWDRTELIQQDARGIIIGVGANEDFEHQPVALTEPRRGLVWTSGEPPLSREFARSGSQSLVIRGRQWPNLPQVSLIPGARYRLEGWYHVVPWTADDLRAAKSADGERRARLTKEGKPLPPERDWSTATPRAFIRGDYFEWSPYADTMCFLQTTSAATGVEPWEHVVLDFTAPDWGPFINVAFIAEDCTAYLDDFALRRLDGQ